MDQGIDLDQLSPGVVVSAAREAKLQLSARPGHGRSQRVTRGSLCLSCATAASGSTVAFAPQLRAGRAARSGPSSEAPYVTHEAQRSPADIRRLPLQDLAGEVDFVLLAGGMARVPAVSRSGRADPPRGRPLHRRGRAPRRVDRRGTGRDDRLRPRQPAPPAVQLRAGVRRRRPAALGARLRRLCAVLRPVVRDAARTSSTTSGACRRADFPRPGTAICASTPPGGRSVDLKFEEDERTRARSRSSSATARRRSGSTPTGWSASTTAADRSQAFRIPTWPVIRGADHATLTLERVASAAPTGDLPPLGQATPCSSTEQCSRASASPAPGARQPQRSSRASGLDCRRPRACTVARFASRLRIRPSCSLTTRWSRSRSQHLLQRAAGLSQLVVERRHPRRDASVDECVVVGPSLLLDSRAPLAQPPLQQQQPGRKIDVRRPVGIAQRPVRHSVEERSRRRPAARRSRGRRP